MKIVLQRCHRARVRVEGETSGEIARGFALFVGIEGGDNEDAAACMARKIVALRVFDNALGRFDLSLRDVQGAILAIPNFTLCGSARKGTRPDFSSSAPPLEALALFNRFVTLLREHLIEVQTGQFGAHMDVYVENDGPVTLIL